MSIGWIRGGGVRRSAFGVRRSAFGVRRSAFGVRRSALGARRSRFAFSGWEFAYEGIWRATNTNDPETGSFVSGESANVSLENQFWQFWQFWHFGNAKSAAYSPVTFRSSLRSVSILPAPRTTDVNGFSATSTGRPVSSRSRLSRFRRSAPPPVRTTPRS
jgi:hypothetical protein